MAELSELQLAVLSENFPVSEDNNRLNLPRLGMLSKDITEEVGKGKTKIINIIEVAGTFYTEQDLGEVNEEGKKVWTKTFIEGDSIEVIIPYFRYQLSKFDKSLKKFISTPIYDSADQVLPLFLDKQIIKKGTEKELQSLYPALTAKGKPTSDLEKKTILFVLYNGATYQMNLSKTSGFEFSNYKRKFNPPALVTALNSIEETNGSNTYKKTTFTKLRNIDSDEFDLVSENQSMIKEVVASDNAFLLGSGEEISDGDHKFIEMATGK